MQLKCGARFENEGSGARRRQNQSCREGGERRQRRGFRNLVGRLQRRRRPGRRQADAGSANRRMIGNGRAGLVVPEVALRKGALFVVALSVVIGTGRLPVVDLRRDLRRAAIEIDFGSRMDRLRHRRPADGERCDRQNDADQPIHGLKIGFGRVHGQRRHITNA